MINKRVLDRLLYNLHWNSKSFLPVVGIEVKILMDDGTIWRCKRETWVTGYDKDPEYTCLTTGYKLPYDQVVAWSYA